MLKRRLRKLILALIGLGLIVGNTDYGIALVLVLFPRRPQAWRLFLMSALIANLQALIWYGLGRILVEVLADCYLSLARWYKSPRIPVITLWFIRRGMAILLPFHDWPNTKQIIRAKIEELRQRPKYIFLAIGSWLILPGSRSLTAIFFGMEEWRGAMAALIIANTLHVALSFGFWAGLFELGRAIARLF